MAAPVSGGAEAGIPCDSASGDRSGPGTGSDGGSGSDCTAGVAVWFAGG